MLTVRPEKPRLVVFAMRSYAGSRSALLLAGEALLMASPNLKVLNGSMMEIFMPEGDRPGFMVLTDSFESALPIENLMGLAHSVEERLNDPQKPGDRTNLRVDLIYVHGVNLKTPEIELPHPALFDRKESWAISTFAVAVEEYIKNPVEAMQILYAWNHATPPKSKSGRSPVFTDPDVKRSPERDEWKVDSLDWPDALAEAVRALAMAHAYRERTKENDGSLTNERVVDKEGASADLRANAGWLYVEESKAEVVELVASSSRSGADDSEVAKDWLTAAREALSLHQLRLSSAVVFAATPEGVRGALLGSREPATRRRLELLDVVADRDPEDLRRWNDYHGEPNQSRIKFSVGTSFSNATFPDQN